MLTWLSRDYITNPPPSLAVASIFSVHGPFCLIYEARNTKTFLPVKPSCLLPRHFKINCPRSSFISFLRIKPQASLREVVSGASLNFGRSFDTIDVTSNYFTFKHYVISCKSGFASGQNSKVKTVWGECIHRPSLVSQIQRCIFSLFLFPLKFVISVNTTVYGS